MDNAKLLKSMQNPIPGAGIDPHKNELSWAQHLKLKNRITRSNKLTVAQSVNVR